MSNRQLPEITKHLLGVKEVIATPDKWCQLTEKTYSAEYHQYQFCMLGAVEFYVKAKYGPHDIQPLCIKIRKELSRAIRRMKNRSMLIHDFNDKPKRTHVEVIQVFDNAIEHSLKNV